MSVALSCFNIGMTKEVLQIIQRAAIHHEARGKGVSHIMKLDSADSGTFDVLFPLVPTKVSEGKGITHFIGEDEVVDRIDARIMIILMFA